MWDLMRVQEQVRWAWWLWDGRGWGAGWWLPCWEWWQSSCPVLPACIAALATTGSQLANPHLTSP